MINKNIIYVAGLPRAGSTLMCQLLGEHPKIYSTGHSSPLANALKRIRAGMSEDPFMMAQMDVDFDLAYQRLKASMMGFVNGWFTETDRAFVVDKNRGWLGDLELLSSLDPAFKMVVCVRAPDQILGSIEARHKKTSLIDFPDGLANLTPFERADQLFSPKGVVGGPLKLIHDLQDIDRDRQSQLYYVLYEDLLSRPVEVMSELFEWLGAGAFDIDPLALTVKPHESDSHYRFKYPHRTHKQIKPMHRHRISNRIMQELQSKFAWFYQLFYPGQ